jgi:hypothetical protein
VSAANSPYNEANDLYCEINRQVDTGHFCVGIDLFFYLPIITFIFVFNFVKRHFHDIDFSKAYVNRNVYLSCSSQGGIQGICQDIGLVVTLKCG